jgi:hypothetical protein
MTKTEKVKTLSLLRLLVAFISGTPHDAGGRRACGLRFGAEFTPVLEVR